MISRTSDSYEFPRLDFRRLPGPVFDPPRRQGCMWAHFPEQRLVIEPTNFPECDLTGLSTRKDSPLASLVIQHSHCLTSLLKKAGCEMLYQAFYEDNFFLLLSGFVETKVVTENCERFSILLMLLWIFWLRYRNYCGANLVQCKSTNRNSDHSVGQAGAIRLAISRALLNFEDSYLELLQQGLIITAVFRVIRNV